MQVLHYWSYERFLERLQLMRQVHRLHCQRAWTGAHEMLQDPWMEKLGRSARQRIKTEAQHLPSEAAAEPSTSGLSSTLLKLSSHLEDCNGEQQRLRVAELQQEQVG